MLQAGEELRVAQEAAVSGGGGRGLREATLAERRAVDAVMTAAVNYKPAGKPLSRAMTDRLRTTLHAAAGDEAIREALAHGRLVDEAQAGGAWPFALEPSPSEERPAKQKPAAKKAGATATKRSSAKADEEAGATKRGAAKAKPKPKLSDAERAAERERKEAEAREAAEREKAEREARKALETELREARTSLRVRERVFGGASEDADAARDAVSQAKAELEQAQKAVEDAIAEAEAAEHVREQARDALDEARDTVAKLEERLD
jgi:hypothetical protein